MSDCKSSYTINRRTGVKLTCNGQHAAANWKLGQAHQARYGGNLWYWYDNEADA